MYCCDKPFPFCRACRAPHCSHTSLWRMSFKSTCFCSRWCRRVVSAPQCCAHRLFCCPQVARKTVSAALTEVWLNIFFASILVLVCYMNKWNISTYCVLTFSRVLKMLYYEYINTAVGQSSKQYSVSEGVKTLLFVELEALNTESSQEKCAPQSWSSRRTIEPDGSTDLVGIIFLSLDYSNAEQLGSAQRKWQISLRWCSSMMTRILRPVE